SNQIYKYDNAGRLIEAQNTPAGKGCTTHTYVYDADGNRSSLTSRGPGTEGKCATEGGTVEKHTFDEADRLNDAGVSYDAWGNTTALPAADAGESELTTNFYSDDAVSSETQNGQTIGYHFDPQGRTLETISTGHINSTVTSHYAGPGQSPSWTESLSGETTRNIRGTDGSLVATQSNGEAPVLQLTNLHGDIIATAYLSETATGLASTADTTEYGVPSTSLPPKYSWLGALEIPTELPSGISEMGARAYVPQLGRFLQTDPVPGGGPNSYSYTNDDPVNESDPTGRFSQPPTWSIELSQQIASEGAAKRAAEEAAARAAAEAAARAAAESAAAYAGMEAEWAGYWAYGPEEEWEEWEEEESGYEWASYQHGDEGNEEAHVEPALLYQPFTEEATSDGSDGDESGGGFRIPIRGGPGGHGCAKRKSCHHHHHYTKSEIETFEHEKCQTIGVGIAVGGNFLPETKLAKAILTGIGIGTALSC
ncbi:MAG: RHS repeat protein, partial [Solirubrobacteraceae bacterium]